MRKKWGMILGLTGMMLLGAQSIYAAEAADGTAETTDAATGQSVVDYAMQFRGNPYVWGGESLTNGVDCSGFTMQVYKHFGYSLPHSSTAQRYEGTAVSWNEKQPGDLICYQVVNGVGHVAIYIGDNQIIHAGIIYKWWGESVMVRSGRVTSAIPFVT